ncbi:MAG: EutN/CcmL family microcompartment protein [Myxococcales bacterium]|nr:EutN/CcmL family microcompartment protein [Myxococcales bacterium]
MFVGKVVGTVWSSVKWPGMTGHKLLLVRPYHLADLLLHPQAQAQATQAQATTGAAAQAASLPAKSPALPPAPAAIQSEAVVCIDLLDAGVGDDVIVAFGHAARVAAESKPPTSAPITPIDAAVVAVVDGIHIVRPGT